MAGPAKNTSQSASKRLLHELKQYQDEPNSSLESLQPQSEDDLFRWTAVMKGQSGTAYEGGLWKLLVEIPPNYPLSPPKVSFATPICHPNIHFKTGEICLDLLKTSWTPAYTISSTMTAIHQLLTSAEPDSPLNVDAAMLFRANDTVAAESLIRYYTSTYRTS